MTKQLTTDQVELVRAALEGLKYGEIVVVVHDGEIVQIARTEKLRTAKQLVR